MASDVKWIKITTDIFEDEKILLIESLPDSYAIITVWFKLLCFAGKQNNSGVLVMGQMAYTDKMLATIFRMKESIVSMALKTFESFGMIETINGVITIPNWGKHQKLDQLENKKEYMRNYMSQYREKQKMLTTGKPICKTNSNTNVRQADKEEHKEVNKYIKEINKESSAVKTESGEKDDVQHIVDLYNSICVSLTPVKILSTKRRNTITKMLKTHSIDQFKQLFENAEASSFLKGKNEMKWAANFDWLLKDCNFVKVFENTFADKKDSGKGNSSFKTQEFFEAAVARRFEENAKNPPKTAADDEAIKQRMKALIEQIEGKKGEETT